MVPWADQEPGTLFEPSKLQIPESSSPMYFDASEESPTCSEALSYREMLEHHFEIPNLMFLIQLKEQSQLKLKESTSSQRSCTTQKALQLPIPDIEVLIACWDMVQERRDYERTTSDEVSDESRGKYEALFKSFCQIKLLSNLMEWKKASRHDEISSFTPDYQEDSKPLTELEQLPRARMNKAYLDIVIPALKTLIRVLEAEKSTKEYDCFQNYMGEIQRFEMWCGVPEQESLIVGQQGNKRFRVLENYSAGSGRGGCLDTINSWLVVLRHKGDEPKKISLQKRLSDTVKKKVDQGSSLLQKRRQSTEELGKEQSKPRPRMGVVYLVLKFTQKLKAAPKALGDSSSTD